MEHEFTPQINMTQQGSLNQAKSYMLRITGVDVPVELQLINSSEYDLFIASLPDADQLKPKDVDFDTLDKLVKEICLQSSVVIDESAYSRERGVAIFITHNNRISVPAKKIERSTGATVRKFVEYINAEKVSVIVLTW